MVLTTNDSSIQDKNNNISQDIYISNLSISAKLIITVMHESMHCISNNLFILFVVFILEVPTLKCIF